MPNHFYLDNFFFKIIINKAKMLDINVPIQLDANICPLKMGGEVAFIMNYNESSKGKGQFEDESLSAHCQNARIVFNVELQTSFWHSKITLFKSL